MTRRRKILLAVTALILLAVGSYFVWPNNEPKYQGRPVSSWFREYCRLRANPADDFRQRQCEYVFKKLGTNALPYFVKQALNTNEDSSLRLKFYELLNRLPESWHPPPFVSRETISMAALEAINQIDPPAKAVFPLLVDNLRKTNSSSFEHAMDVIYQVRDETETFLPFIRMALYEENTQVRESAIRALYRLGSNATPAVPDLMNMLHTNSAAFDQRLNAADALGQIGGNAAPAIPLIQRLFDNETNWMDRCSLAAELCQIDENQSNALHYLVGMLKNPPETGMSYWVANKLGEIGPNAKAAIPAIIDAMSDATNGLSWERAIDALDRLSAPEGMYLPRIKERLASRDDHLRFDSAAILLLKNPQDPEAISVLVRFIDENSTFSSPAIWSLGDAGTNAKAAIPAIMAVFERTNYVNWAYACDALKKMGAPTESFLPKLKGKLSSAPFGPRWRIALKILEFEPTDHESLLVMIDVVKGEFPSASGAARRLGNAGAAAKDAIPVLRQALKAKDPELRDAAQDALKKIETPEPKK